MRLPERSTFRHITRDLAPCRLGSDNAASNRFFTAQLRRQAFGCTIPSEGIATRRRGPLHSRCWATRDWLRRGTITASFATTEPATVSCSSILIASPQPGSIDALLSRYATDKCQDRFGRRPGNSHLLHPKEYDRTDYLQTHWASQAFCLVDATFYASIGGMDDSTFCILRTLTCHGGRWLSGYQVLPYLSRLPPSLTLRAAASHYALTSSPTRPSIPSRNFLLISRKFFGEAEKPGHMGDGGELGR